MLAVGTTIWCKSTWAMEMTPHIVQAVIQRHSEATRFSHGEWGNVRYHVPCYWVFTENAECDPRFEVLHDEAYPTLEAATEAIAAQLQERIAEVRRDAEKAARLIRSYELTLEKFCADPTGQLAAEQRLTALTGVQ